MERRNFIRSTALCAVAVSASGFIRFNGKQFKGDCETTTDILGPFYRPDAPIRRDLRIANAKGQPVVLSGKVKHKDCTTPLKHACVEIWHCDGEGVYDNDSADFKYRAKTYSDDNGNYSFTTIIPVPYEVGQGISRPAHYHMMFSADGYQSLITQLYFAGDKYLSKDSSASLPAAKKRTLSFTEGTNGEKALSFNVTMLDKIPADVAVIERLAGEYVKASGKEKKASFYRRENLLWIRDAESINGGYPLQYNGHNTFESYGEKNTQFVFTVQTNGSVKVVFTTLASDGKTDRWEAVKA
jgi:protocatechuate 3,4-dioxygenase beta subunit